MASRRTFQRVIAVLGCLCIALAGCGNRGDSGQKPPTAEEVAAAEYTMLAATQTMFTWYPTVDASPADAYQRAAPALRGDMRASFNSITDGAAALWPRWRQDKLTLTAASQFTPGSQATNASGQIERSVVVTQTAMFPDGKVDTSRVFKVDRVVAKYGNDGWKVEAINFFPENQFFIPACPPGNTHDPAPDGPCKPIPPPPTKTCPDGTSVPAGAVCPAQRNQPQTKQCPDGSTVPEGAACATHGPRTKQCPDGSTVLIEEECVTTGTPPCPDGQTRGADGTCTSPTVTCPDGSTAPSVAECPKVEQTVTCPDGTSAPSEAECPKPKAAEPCPISGQFRGADGSCTCGAGRATYPEGCGDYIGAPAPGIDVVAPPLPQPASFRRPLRRRRMRGLQCCHAGRPSAAHRRRC